VGGLHVFWQLSLASDSPSKQTGSLKFTNLVFLRLAPQSSFDRERTLATGKVSVIDTINTADLSRRLHDAERGALISY